ncbi:hypothetical protein [Labilithrix luteola]|nr:hypothetical protein [Labilithrix luteola]
MSSRIGRALLATSMVAGLLLLTNGCASVVGADFDEAVATPTHCSLVAPQTANERSYARCNSTSTCALDDDTGNARCVGLAAYGAVGERCEYLNDCSPGLLCTTAIGCSAYCAIGSSCADGAACIPLRSRIAVNGEQYGFCPPPSCDPLHPTEPDGNFVACSTGQCRFIAEDRTACFLASATPQITGSACDDDLGCRPTDTCVENRCQPLCRMGQNDCLNGWTCVEGASDAQSPTLDGTTYGHCVR